MRIMVVVALRVHSYPLGRLPLVGDWVDRHPRREGEATLLVLVAVPACPCRKKVKVCCHCVLPKQHVIPQSHVLTLTLVASSHTVSHQPLSHLTTASAPTPTNQGGDEIDSVEGAGLRSRVLEMQQRVEQLEREKMVLSMAKAPLEARFRQKEDAWTKEQNRLLQEIDSLMQASREADERYRDLAVKYDAVTEEIKKLRLSARKAAFSANTNQGDTSIWNRQLQNDREVDEMKDKLRHAEEEIKSLRLEKVSVEKEVNATKMELESIIRSYDELQAEYDELAASSSDNREAEIKLEVLSTEHIATSAQLNAVCSDLAATKARAEATMEAKEEEHKKEVEQLLFDMSVLKTRAAKVQVDDDPSTTMDTDEEDEAVLRARIEERDRRIAELESQVLKGEQLRRQMHNRIQELRGNIRVYVRTRPFLPGDGDALDSSIDVCPDGESLCITDNRTMAPHDFKFDKVFAPSAGQDNVFAEVSDFVQSALDGYHVCLFSYGQTGSGKTHTMQGSGNGAMRGIIPRAVEQILSQAKLMQSQKWDFKMSASFLEIYNEELKDLLVAMAPGGKPSKPVKLGIKRDRQGKSFVDGLSQIPIDTIDSSTGMQQLEALMSAAARARSVASTKMNAHSSRSHSVFMLHLHGYNADSGATVQGALNLCDLAGSERLDRSGAGSDAKRLKETQAINKSLSCLGDVFNALATGASHVPYRNSKLTYLLQDCLSGDGKALMFVNLSPTFASSNESLCSLRFAQRVNQVELGKPTKHIQYSSSSKVR
jgi:kinesin family protein C1